MKFNIERSQIEKLISSRNGYLTLAAGLLLLCILQTTVIFFLIGKERTFLVPPTIQKSFWVSSNQVSPEYLSEMTTFFSQVRFNVTPSSIDQQREQLLRYVDPVFYNKLKTKLVEEGDRIQKENLTMSFFPVNIKVDEGHLKVVIEGDLKSYVGETPLPVQRVKFLVSYGYDSGRLLVRSFEEVKND